MEPSIIIIKDHIDELFLKTNGLLLRKEYKTKPQFIDNPKFVYIFHPHDFKTRIEKRKLIAFTLEEIEVVKFENFKIMLK